MDKQQLVFFYINIASSSLSLVPLVISVINFIKIDLILKPIFWLVVINVTVEILSFVFLQVNFSNKYMLHYFTVAEFGLISLFYSFFLKDYFKPLLIYLLIPVFLLAAIIDYKVYGLSSSYNFSSSVECILLIFYSLFFFYYVLKNLIFENLLSTPVFWVNTAILFYFSGNLILFVFSNYMAMVDPLKLAILWSVIHTFFNVLYNVFLSIGFWKTRGK
ncbi:MAG: hypothetical protein JNJ41_02810 [Bacteroidia bacterium]|nr:hypothetical protein [Bacteroidia bacterium]